MSFEYGGPILPLSGNGVTVTLSTPLINLSQTWNNAAIDFIGKTINITNTASGSGARVENWKVGGVEIAYISPTGSFNASNLLRTVNGVAFGTTIGSGDTFLTRKAAANVQLGNFDAAAPVAQILSVQSVITATADTAGVDWTFNASRGTGTGAGGGFIFKTAPAGGAGSTQNALATALTISSAGNTQLASGKSLQLGNAATTGLTAGVLAALTNATIVILDSTGQAYRIPCII